LHTLGRLEDAEQDLGRILLKNPCDAAALGLWQELRAQRGLTSDAPALPAPKDAQTFITRGQAFAQNNELRRAIADYDAAIALTPAPFAFLYRGLAYQALGDLTRARADLEVWVKVDPGWAPALAAIDAQLKATPVP
jgi:tetratricopeptide (TPR) repeat protein